MVWRKSERESNLVQQNKQHEAERKKLLEGITPIKIKKNIRDRQLATQAADTTGSLNSLVRRMGDEVKLSEQTTTILSQSSGMLSDTQGHMGTIGQTIRASGKLLHKYGRREFTDKILLMLALLLYFGVCIYILRKRVFIFKFPDWW
ncbi:unnamed protein product [Bursaphelenchus xylophilus]|uniref:(pine wood nematode) hypothetical protein n=1 Tax=Bursaphelenchus xylophilus TaxID=6326 RepID=A0A1I7RL68_BURXY|nr:unnamed protein product [Bursaphelenchus xylophilus]CAG9083384.1 unnamed protein product [Bursaphelenchus xylophilus]